MTEDLCKRLAAAESESTRLREALRGVLGQFRPLKDTTYGRYGIHALKAPRVMACCSVGGTTEEKIDAAYKALGETTPKKDG